MGPLKAAGSQCAVWGDATLLVAVAMTQFLTSTTTSGVAKTNFVLF